ncbi:MAG: CopD family protein [SAR202 cluster bacterium]|nr:CopD family protein [SAR202 cluster bacterium]
MYQAAVIIHVISAITWLGGMLFLVLVMLSLARKDMASEQPGPGLAMLKDAANRFLPVAWSAMMLLAVTGAYLAWEHWGIRPGVFFTNDSRFMHILQIKSGLFLFVLVSSLLHDFWLGPKILERLQRARAAGLPPPQSLGRRLVLMTARVNLLVVLTIVVLAVLLIRP